MPISPSKTIVALDVMGCDLGVGMVVQSASMVAKDKPHVHFIFYGCKHDIQGNVEKFKSLQGRYEIVHTSRVIAPDEKASRVLRTGRDSSMAMAFQSVKKGDAQCAVSGGNTGALMALSMFTLGLIDKVSRPALCAVVPTQKGFSTVLDLGANISADVKNLVQYSIMGTLFHRILYNVASPTVGILNVGSEYIKGSLDLQKTADILCTHTGIQYYGFVEGDDLTKGTTDVVVTDGFSGNVALKAMEGMSVLIMKLLKKHLATSMLGILAILWKLFMRSKLKKLFDPSSYNGAIMLGLNGIVVKSHGGAKAIGFAKAIELAILFAEQNFVTSLCKEIDKIDALD